MILDDLLSRFDVAERHTLVVRASSADTFAALESTDLAASGIVRALLMLRALPGALLSGISGFERLRLESAVPVTLSALESHGFRRLATDAPREIVLGLEGKFWRPGGGLCTPDADFAGPPAPGHARAVWNFELTPTADGGTMLATETRVLCADASARRRFLPYWMLIRPASGFLRRKMLQAIRRNAEERSRRGAT